MKQILVDYMIKFDVISILCDNTSAIDSSKNLVSHSRTKHIDIRHHFLRDHVNKGDILMVHIDFNYKKYTFRQRALPIVYAPVFPLSIATPSLMHIRQRYGNGCVIHLRQQPLFNKVLCKNQKPQRSSLESVVKTLLQQAFFIKIVLLLDE